MARKIDPLKRESILRAGRTVFLRDGYAAAKMSDIAAEAGVAPGTLYLYFDSKEVLAGAIGEDFFSRLSREFTEVIAEVDKPNGIRHLVDWTLRIASEERDLLKLLKQQQHQPGQCHEEDQNGPKVVFHRQMSAGLKRLMERQGVRQYDADALAAVVMSILSGLMMSSIYTEQSHTEKMKVAAVKLLEHALFEDGAVRSTVPVSVATG
jgi:AcrR family transcriptional regulator